MLMVKRNYIFFLVVLLTNPEIIHAQSYGNKSKTLKNQSEINWVIDRQHIQKPRGGTTKGLKPELDSRPSEYYTQLSKSRNLKDKDRYAILSMIGEFRSNFEFTEMFGSTFDYELDSPYKSWGTEMVIPIEVEEDFISLQHIIMMHFTDESGEVLNSHVVKHWRQDWKYEDKNIFTYQPDMTWKNIKPQDISETWSQSVYQVDDTPRYESYGKWVHGDGGSKWISQITPRPLPRREFSVRDDYDFLSGVNKITILPWGWVMEEMNDKVTKENDYIGSEYGIARYQKIKNYDFEAANEYWSSTKDYWHEVRLSWNSKLNNESIVCTEKYIDDQPSYIFYFMGAESFAEDSDISQAKEDIKSITNKFSKKDCS